MKVSENLKISFVILTVQKANRTIWISLQLVYSKIGQTYRPGRQPFFLACCTGVLGYIWGKNKTPFLRKLNFDVDCKSFNEKMLFLRFRRTARQDHSVKMIL